jgi:hypothetical protein
MNAWNLRLAHLAVAIGGASAAVGTNYGWNHQSVEEKGGCCEDQ